MRQMLNKFLVDFLPELPLITSPVKQHNNSSIKYIQYKINSLLRLPVPNNTQYHQIYTL